MARPVAPVVLARLVAVLVVLARPVVALVVRVQPVAVQAEQVLVERARLVAEPEEPVLVERARAVQEPAVVHLSQVARPSRVAHLWLVVHPRAEAPRLLRAPRAPWADPRPESWIPQALRFPVVPVMAERRSPTRQRMQDKAESLVEAARPEAAEVPVPVHPTVESFILRLRTSGRLSLIHI